MALCRLSLHASAFLVAALVSSLFDGIACSGFRPICPTAPPASAPWRRWSSPSTWAPAGVPRPGQNVIIPCGKKVLLDVPNVSLGTLDIRGSLMVEDAVRNYALSAHWIIVQGLFAIGSKTQHFRRKIVITLTRAPNGRELMITRPPASAAAPAKLGVKGFVVVGGQVVLNGMPGGLATPAWAHLARTFTQNQNQIFLRRSIAGWPVGASIAITSTDFDQLQAETFTIRGKIGATGLILDRRPTWSHWGTSVPSGIPGRAILEAAEVALLTRNIVIKGSKEPANPLDGGHFVVFKTSSEQFISGVEFTHMGQQGILGRYPLHYHLALDATTSIVQKNAIHHVNQRCVVIHGTNKLRIYDNVGFNTSGHCFMLEDGYEQQNTFKGNLAFLTKSPKKNIQSSDPHGPITDNAPASYWIPNPNNNFLGNVAGGSENSGWWIELTGNVQGPCAAFPDANQIKPHNTPLGRFSGNSAHSNGRAGLRTYPGGYRPRKLLDRDGEPVEVFISYFRGWKNVYNAMFIHETDSLTITKSQFADNGLSVEFQRAENNKVVDSLFIGESINLGNPTGCHDGFSIEYKDCRPLHQCTLPADKARSRSVFGISRYRPLFGVLIDQYDHQGHGPGPRPNHIWNSTFGRFRTYCGRPAAGITANGKDQSFWNAGHSLKAIKWANDGTVPVYMGPHGQGIIGFESASDGGEQVDMYAYRDLDGSVVGGRGGYVIAKNPRMTTRSCTLRPSWNGYVCPGNYFRTVLFEGSQGGIRFTRADGKVYVVNGKGGHVYANLMSGTHYTVQFLGSPQSVKISYSDRNPGPTPVKLRLNGGWSGPTVDTVRPCAGVGYTGLTLTPTFVNKVTVSRGGARLPRCY